MKNNLKTLCKIKRVTQTRLANELFLTVSAINQWVQNVTQPRIDDIFMICKILDCSIGDIYLEFKELG